MKKGIAVLSIAILAVMIFSSVANAALPGLGWWTFYQVQNVGTANGFIQMMAYDSASTATYSSSQFYFDPGVSLAYHPGLAPTYPTGDRIGFTTELPDGFQGSVALSASVPVVAIAQLGNNTSGTVGAGGTASSFYQGAGSDFTANQLNFPTVKHNFYSQTTTFYIQAAGADANVTITYKMNDGSTYTQNASISANRMVVFDPLGAGIPAGSTLPADVNPSLGAAKVVSTTGKIAGVVAEHPHMGSPAPFVLASRGLTTADTDYTLFAPTIKNAFFGGTTGFSVQNTGAQPALARITLTVTNATNPALIGTTYTDDEIIPAGGQTVFSANRGNLGGMPAGTFAAAKVQSIDDATYNPQLLAGTVNESNNMGKATYAAFSQSASKTEVGLPMVKEMFFNNTTGVAVVNVGTAPTKFYATYTDANGVIRQFETVNAVAPGAAVSFFKVYTNPDSKFTGLADFSVLLGTKNSVTITSDGVQPIVALAQESDQYNLDGILDVKNYEGFGLE